MNRHFFGMGNNIIAGSNLPYANYAPSGGDSMNHTHSGFKGAGGLPIAEPNAGPHRSRYLDDKSNGTAEKDNRFNTQESTGKQDTENIILDQS